MLVLIASFQPCRGWIENALKTDSPKWELIEDLDELEEHAKQWYALFYHNNKSAAEIAKNNNHHALSSNMVLSEFSKLSRTRKKFEKPTKITSKDFFSPFNHPSKNYVIFDPQFFTDIQWESKKRFKTLFGFRRSKVEMPNSHKINPYYYEPTKEIEAIASLLFFYIDWIDKSIKGVKNNIKPNIYIVCKTNDGGDWFVRTHMIIIEKLFKQYVNKMKTEGDMMILKEYLNSNKVHFIYINQKEFKAHGNTWGKTYLHGNIVMTDYGYIYWDYRKRFIKSNKKVYSLTYSAGEIKETQKIENSNIFQEDFSETGEWANFYKVFNEIIENDKNKRRECINNHLINEGIINFCLDETPSEQTIYYNEWVKKLEKDRELSWIYNRLSKVLKICYALCFQLAFLEQMTTLSAKAAKKINSEKIVSLSPEEQKTIKARIAQLKKKWN